MTLETVVGSLITSVCTAFLVAYLQRGNEQTKFFREKLLDRYSEFVALAAADLVRALAVNATMGNGGKDTDYAEAAKIEEKRHILRLDLLRASLQIRLLETDDTLAKKVEEIAKSQPFMAFPFPPRWGDGNYNERSDKFDAEIAAFDKLLSELVSAVLQRHSARALGVRA